MKDWPLYISMFATATSVAGLTRIAFHTYDKKQPHTLSELATAQDYLLRRFRTILWFCGTLFSVAMYGSIIPASGYSAWLFAAWTAVYGGNLLAGTLPAKGATKRSHELSAQLMAVGMLAVAFIFWLDSHSAIQLAITIAMTLLGFATFLDTKRFIFYELPFLYLSHISIIVAAINLGQH